MENDNGIPKRMREVENRLSVTEAFVNDLKKYLMTFIITLLGLIAFNIYAHTTGTAAKINELEKKVDRIYNKLNQKPTSSE